jgi:hypothetical protein
VLVVLLVVPMTAWAGHEFGFRDAGRLNIGV